MSKFPVLVIIFLILSHTYSFAQDKLYYTDYAEFIKQNLNKSVYEIDSTASAVVLHERAIYSVKRLLYGYANVRVKVRRLVKILKKDAIGKGDIVIQTPFKVAEFLSASGTSYNWEDGKIVSQSFDKHNFKTELLNGYQLIGKLSLPSVKVGTVIDYEYDVDNNIALANINWPFQHSEPKLYTEVQIIYPKAATLLYITKSDKEFVFFKNENPVLSDKELPEAYRFDSKTESITVSKTWVRRQVPALKSEPLVTNLNNYSERIQFIFSNQQKQISSWDSLNSTLYHSPLYFKGLSARDTFLKKRVDSIVSNISSDREKVRAIFSYVRDSIAAYFSERISPCCIAHDVLKKKKGSLSDVNYLMVLMLREAGFNSYPVLISTTDNERVSPNVPLIQRFNFLACGVEADNDFLYLDAHDKLNPFGSLPYYCYNGLSWIVDSVGRAVDLTPELIKDRHIVLVTTDSDSADDYRISVKETFGQVSSKVFRSRFSKDSSAFMNHVQESLKKIPFESELISYELINEKNSDTTLSIKYIARIDWKGTDREFALVPAIYGHYPENPFKSASRSYPVEFPYGHEYYYSLNLKIPEGFTVSEIPKSGVIKLSNEDQYSYYISFIPETNDLMLNTKYQQKNTTIDVDGYADFRKFIDDIIELQQQACLITKRL